MNDLSTQVSNDLQPSVMLVLSRALSASRPALIAFLIARGSELSGGVIHPVSFCNILFVGNLCAALAVGFWFGFHTIISDLKKLKPMPLAGLIINGILATVLATLIFTGLQDTSVTNAVLLGRLGPVLFALLGALLLGRKIRVLEWFGFSLIVVGVVAIALKTNEFMINRGDLLILLSTVVFALSSLVNKLMVAKAASLSSVVFSRNLLSSVIFFFIAMRLFGPDHFGDAFSGRLWIIMSIYALIVIVLAQFLWYASVAKLDAKTIGKLTVLSPIFGITYAFLLNGERPSGIQVITLVIVIAGVAIASFGGSNRKIEEPTMMSAPENAASMS